jgi:hypothetical protein
MNLLKNNLYARVPLPGDFKTLGICSNFVGEVLFVRVFSAAESGG